MLYLKEALPLEGGEKQSNRIGVTK